MVDERIELIIVRFAVIGKAFAKKGAAEKDEL